MLSIGECRKFIHSCVQLAERGDPAKAHDKLWREMTDTDHKSTQWKEITHQMHVIEREYCLPCF